MTPLRVAFSTLGCKLNQLETEAIADAFSSAGALLSSFGEAAELYVLNTCTVTGKAEQIFVTGLSLPNTMRQYVDDGAGQPGPGAGELERGNSCTKQLCN